MTKTASGQFLLLLTDMALENTNLVVERIQGSWQQNAFSARYTLRFESDLLE